MNTSAERNLSSHKRPRHSRLQAERNFSLLEFHLDMLNDQMSFPLRQLFQALFHFMLMTQVSINLVLPISCWFPFYIQVVREKCERGKGNVMDLTGSWRRRPNPPLKRERVRQCKVFIFSKSEVESFRDDAALHHQGLQQYCLVNWPYMWSVKGFVNKVGPIIFHLCLVKIKCTFFFPFFGSWY